MISGIPASMTRTGDYLVYKAGDDKRSDLYNRFDYINSVDNAVLVSFSSKPFCRYFPVGDAQIWYTVNDPLSKALAANILAYDKQHLQPGNRRQNKSRQTTAIIWFIKLKCPP